MTLLRRNDQCPLQQRRFTTGINQIQKTVRERTQALTFAQFLSFVYALWDPGYGEAKNQKNQLWVTVTDLRGGGGREGRSQILSISCSFWENLAKSYVGAPRLAPPPRGNPGSATGSLKHCFAQYI